MPSRRPQLAIIGRQSELSRVAGLLDSACDGDVGVLVVSGAAGMGKSTLLRGARLLALERQMRVGAGRWVGGLVAPLLALVEAFEEIEPGATDEFLGVLPDVLPADYSPEVHRFIAARHLLQRLAASRPVVLLLDDLHDADPASLAVLEHLVFGLGQVGRSARVAIVVATRPGEERPADALSRLRREPIVRVMDLGGLDEPAVNELLVARLGGTVAGMVAPTVDTTTLHRVMEATVGVPLLVETWAVAVAAGRPEPSVSELASVDAAVATRLAGLDESEHLALVVLAAAGVPCRRSLVASIAGTTVDVVDRLILGGLANVVAADSVEVAHPVIAAMATSLVSHEARSRIHVALAVAIDRDDLDVPGDTVLAAAHHRRIAGPADDPGAYVAACLDGARRAYALGAWAESVAYADAASVRDLAALSNIDLLQAGIAGFRSLDPTVAERYLGAAANAAQRSGDVTTWGHAVLYVGRVRFTQGTGGAGRMVDIEPLTRFLEASEGTEPLLRAQVFAMLAEMAFQAMDVEAGHEFATSARREAAEAGDVVTEALVDTGEGLVHLGALHMAQADELFARPLRHTEHFRPWHPGWAVGRRFLTLLMLGRVPDAEAELRRAELVARSNDDWAELSLLRAVSVNVYAARGEHAAMERAVADARRFHLRSAYTFTPFVLWPSALYGRAIRGDTSGVIGATEEYGAVGGRMALSRWADAITGRDEERAHRWLDRWVPPSELTLFSLGSVCAAVETGDAIDRTDVMAAAQPLLAKAASAGVVVGLEWPVSIHRLLAVAAARNGDHAAAAHYFDEAERLGERAGLTVERARALADRARLSPHMPTADAAALAVRAADELDRLGGLALAGRARRLATELGGGPVVPRDRCILATDIVDSTKLTVGLGDEAWNQLLSRHDTVLRDAFRRHGGSEVNHTGDGMISWFPSIDDGITAVLEMNESLAVLVRTGQIPEMRIRAGLAVGPAVERDGNMFGATVVAAARVCAVGGAGEIHARTADLAHQHGDGWSAEVVGDRVLKGFPESVRISKITRMAALAPR